MNVWSKGCLRLEEWVALAASVVVFVCAYLFLIHPSMELVARHDQASEQRRQAEADLRKARERLEELQVQITRHRQRLNELGGSPPGAAERELQISRVTALAAACQLSVDQYLPIDTVEESDHQAAFVQFAGRGDFAAIRAYLGRLETQLEFIDISHFSITADPRETGCRLSWSCRINGIRAEDAPGELRPGKTLVGGVALR